MGIDTAAYDCGRPCEFWPDPEGCSLPLGFEVPSDRPLAAAKFAKSFEVSPLQADLTASFTFVTGFT